MRRLAFAVAFGLAGIILQPAAGYADEKLTADEIQVLLKGHTALGNWRGAETRQYFDADGSTIYLDVDTSPEEGKWKVDEAKNQYCSWWERTGWSCYNVETDGRMYYWVSPDDAYRSSFMMTDGRQLGY